MRLRAVLFTSVLGLAACAAAPTAPSGPVLPKGPEHGRIENNAYYDQRDWYSVTLPFQPGEEGYDSLSVTEEYPGHVSYAAFIPAYTAGEYYRVYLEDFYATNQPVPDLATVADMAMRFFGKELLQERLEPVRLLEEKSWDTGNTTGYLRLYTEKAPIAPLLTNLAMAEDYTATILMYVTVRDGKVAVVWAEWPVGCAPCKPVPAGPPAKTDDPIDQAAAANTRALQFIESFRYVAG